MIIDELFNIDGWVPQRDWDIPPAFSFASQESQYPRTGPTGIGYFKGELNATQYVDSLLYRDESGQILGILNHYPHDILPYEREGNVNIFIHPSHKRKGIGTALLVSASSRWSINLRQQRYTEQGRLFVTSLIERANK